MAIAQWIHVFTALALSVKYTSMTMIVSGECLQLLAAVSALFWKSPVVSCTLLPRDSMRLASTALAVQYARTVGASIQKESPERGSKGRCREGLKEEKKQKLRKEERRKRKEERRKRKEERRKRKEERERKEERRKEERERKEMLKKKREWIKKWMDDNEKYEENSKMEAATVLLSLSFSDVSASESSIHMQNLP